MAQTVDYSEQVLHAIAEFADVIRIYGGNKSGIKIVLDELEYQALQSALAPRLKFGKDIGALGIGNIAGVTIEQRTQNPKHGHSARDCRTCAWTAWSGECHGRQDKEDVIREWKSVGPIGDGCPAWSRP